MSLVGTVFLTKSFIIILNTYKYKLSRLHIRKEITSFDKYVWLHKINEPHHSFVVDNYKGQKMTVDNVQIQNEHFEIGISKR